jgi:hypothetical protein
MYYYVIDEYRVSNQLLTEDIYVRARRSEIVGCGTKANGTTGAAVGGATDRRLCEDAGGEGRD